MQALTDAEIAALAETTCEDVETHGKEVSLTTIHERRNGSHWVVVIAWSKAILGMSTVLALEGFECGPEGRRTLTDAEAQEGL